MPIIYLGIVISRQGLDEHKKEHRQKYPELENFCEFAGPESTAEDLRSAYIAALRENPGCPPDDKSTNAAFARAVEGAKADRRRRGKPDSGQWFAYKFKYDYPDPDS